jgi:hypothetical protein
MDREVSGSIHGVAPFAIKASFSFDKIIIRLRQEISFTLLRKQLGIVAVFLSEHFS